MDIEDRIREFIEEMREHITDDELTDRIQEILDRRIYIVQEGDTLSKIAGMLDTSVEDLCEKNDLFDPNRIYIGQRLEV